MFKKIKTFLWMLVAAPDDPNKVSQTKLWSNIGMLAMTIVFLHMGYTGTLPEWYAWIYAPSVACPQLISKFVTLRWGWKGQHSDGQCSDDRYSDNRWPEYSDSRYSEHSGDRYSDPTESENCRDFRR